MATDPQIDIRMEVDATRFFVSMLGGFVGWQVRLSFHEGERAVVGRLVRVEVEGDGRDPLLTVKVGGVEETYPWSVLARVKPMAPPEVAA